MNMKICFIPFVLLSIVLVLLTGCNDQPFPEAAYPILETLPVTNVGPSGATFSAVTVQAGTEEVLNRGFVWSTHAGVTVQSGTRIDVGPGDGNFEAVLSSTLTNGTMYYVKAYVVTKGFTVYGPVQEFKNN